MDNSPYIRLWGVLSLAFAAIAGLSFVGGVEWGAIKLKSSGLVEALSAVQEVQEVPDDSLAYLDEAVARFQAVEGEDVCPVDTAAQTILFLGDSMVEVMYPRLAAYCEASGHTLYAAIWYSSDSQIWGKSRLLSRYIRRVSPSFIIICLGANELFVKDIAEKRTQFVKSIIAEADTIPYLWVGPPNWKEDTGINAIIAASGRRGAYFDSSKLRLDRKADGAHPTDASAALWVDSVVKWIPGHHFHPIRMEVPVKERARAKKVFTHQPGEKP